MQNLKTKKLKGLANKTVLVGVWTCWQSQRDEVATAACSMVIYW